MRISNNHPILFLGIISSIFVYFPNAIAACAGGCAISTGGGSSNNFMADPAANIDMSSFDDFVRDNIGNHQTTFHAKSISQDNTMKINSSLDLINNKNKSNYSLTVFPKISNLEGNTFDNKTVKLGNSGLLRRKLSTLALANFNNNMF